MKSLYAYFGLLDLHDIDSPGHSLYQMGLVASISESFQDCGKFDFYSYYPVEVINSAKLKGFPNTQLGELFGEYRYKLFDEPIHYIDLVLDKISNREYSKLFLKARFRNLSTLAKKWKDARDFEQIINCAVLAGYTKEDIIILDTDLSLPDSFYKTYSDKVTIKIPSIDFPGISLTFLTKCLEINLENKQYSRLSGVFYGNIDTSKYKAGNSKNPILGEVIEWITMSDLEKNEFTLICKNSDYLGYEKCFKHVPRNMRDSIWETLENSTMMLNITKDKYNERRFIPARIFEALIFGMIPVSYKFDFLCKAFSFENLEDFIEIYKYLDECDEEGLKQAHTHFVESYVKYHDSIFIHIPKL